MPTTCDEHILIVDDEPDFAHGLARLVSRDFPAASVSVALSGAEALHIIQGSGVALLLTDLRMPDMDGMELMQQAMTVDPTTSVILLTAHGSIETAVAALKNGAYDFLTKPVRREELQRTLNKALERIRILKENKRLRQMMQQGCIERQMIGESPVMQRLKETIAAIAATDYSVLIRGESGTGKELVADMLHRLGSRRERPLVKVNCPSIPDQLLESELFGHVKGAFTGADRTRRGLFMSAQRGTLLLDEIGDIGEALQTKLLRVLQEREIRPVGSSASTLVDVRIIASTNRALEERIKQGLFREDLFYRLNVLTIHTPPPPRTARRHPTAGRPLRRGDLPGALQPCETHLTRRTCLSCRKGVARQCQGTTELHPQARRLLPGRHHRHRPPSSCGRHDLPDDCGDAIPCSLQRGEGGCRGGFHPPLRRRPLAPDGRQHIRGGATFRHRTRVTPEDPASSGHFRRHVQRIDGNRLESPEQRHDLRSRAHPRKRLFEGHFVMRFQRR